MPGELRIEGCPATEPMGAAFKRRTCVHFYNREDRLKPDTGKKVPKTGPKGTSGSKGRPFSSMPEKPGNTMVMATIASVVVAALFRVDVVSPLLFAAAVFPFFYGAMRRNDHRSGVALVFRWAVTLFVSILVVGVFIPDRLGAALPLSEEAVRTLEIWIRKQGTSPPGDLGYLLWGMFAFLVASLVSGGLLGFIIGAVAIGGAAYGALFVCRNGLNILQIGLVAVPIWQLCAFVAGAFLLVPMSVFVFERFFHIEKRAEDWEKLRHYMYVGAGFFGLSVALRYIAAGVWRALLERWTVL
jgi:hypothetical protein